MSWQGHTIDTRRKRSNENVDRRIDDETNRDNQNTDPVERLNLNRKMNGNGWANVDLAVFDEDKKLTTAGGRTAYAIGYVWRQTVTIRRTVDAVKLLAESTEENNLAEATLAP